MLFQGEQRRFSPVERPQLASQMSDVSKPSQQRAFAVTVRIHTEGCIMLELSTISRFLLKTKASQNAVVRLLKSRRGCACTSSVSM
jgi:hypothetical protein